MALADSVPGVSGGTIAFLLGFYDKFIGSLNDIISVTNEEKKESVKFLLKIGIGWIVGMALAILFITAVFESHIYQISSLFIGFIIFAIPIIVKEEKECLKGKYFPIIFEILGIIFVCAISYFSGTTLFSDGVNLAAGKFNAGVGIMLFIAGVVAISAMVLPGISGSTILLIFGLYAPILNGVKEILKLNFEYLPGILIFGFGVLLGVLLTVRTVRHLLRNFRSQTIYCIIGLMIGSIYSVIMGPTSLEIPRPPMSVQSFSIIFFIIGCTLVPALEKLKDVLKNKETELEIESI